MLTKLIRYELRASGRMIPFVYLAAIFLAVAGLATSLSHSIAVLMISYTLLILSGSAAMIITYVVVFVRFYKGMYGAEGYLAHTLPVDVTTLYRSKTAVAMLWMLLSGIVACATWAVAALNLVRVVEMTGDVLVSVSGTSLDLSQIFTAPFILWCIASMIISYFSFLAIVFFCITLSTVKPFSKLGVGSSVLAYVAISIVNYIITTLIMAGVPLSLKFSFETGWGFTSQTMWSWFMSTLRPDTEAGFVISIGLNIPPLLLAIFLPILSKRLIERKMIVK